MLAILVFAAALFVAALISEYAHRSIVSTTVLFLVVGFFAGPRFLGAIQVAPQAPLVSALAGFAMFTVLFIDGMELPAQQLRRKWRLAALALGIGLPLTVAVMAGLAHLLLGLDWTRSFLIAAVLAPTDPVFASAIVVSPAIPARLRNLLNIESGLNDGLALPIVIVLLDLLTDQHTVVWRILGNVVLGILLGIAVPWLGHRLERLRAFTVADDYEPLFAVALGLFVYSAATLTDVNPYLAAFAAGATVTTVQPRLARTFCKFGEVVAEILKLATVMVFGALLSPQLLTDVSLNGYLFALLTLVLVRPVALEVALLRARLSVRERIAAYWFGPKGFASVVYGVMVLRAQVVGGDELFAVIAVVVGLSIIAHSSTDVIVARWFEPRPAHGL